jgi:PadR family transcriptional regulator, regulatory protein AphA
MAGDSGLSSTSYVVLGLLASLGPATPYDLKRVVATTLGNLWSFPHSQFYAEPERLAAAGLVTERREEGGRRRRTYSLTPKGRRELMLWLNDPEVPGHEVRDAGLLKLFFGDLTGEADVAALARAQELVHQTRAADYRRLAADSGDDDLPFRAASMRMGQIFERASARFWRTVAEELGHQ